MVYAKIFNSLYSGTLRGRAHEILVFTNLLAFCDQDGVVDRHPRTIAEDIGLTIEETWEALRNLNEPDPESRSPEEGGRRIVLLEDHRNWGWVIVNHAKYKAIRHAEDRREAGREYTRRSRARKNGAADVSAPVSIGKQCKPIQIQIQTTDTEKEKKAAAPLIPVPLPEAFEGYRGKLEEWVKYRRQAGFKPWTVLTWQKTLEKWVPGELSAAIDNSIANGYQGVFKVDKDGFGRQVVRVSTGDEF